MTCLSTGDPRAADSGGAARLRGHLRPLLALGASRHLPAPGTPDLLRAALSQAGAGRPAARPAAAAHCRAVSAALAEYH